MKTFLKLILQIASVATIVGAHLTQLPILVTIATALYWIVSILLPTCLILMLLIGAVYPAEIKAVLIRGWGSAPTWKFMLGLVSSFTILGTYAFVGWAFPFAMTMIFVIWMISVRFSNTQVG